MLRQAGKGLCWHVASGSSRDTEVPLKKEYTGLGDRLAKAEGEPEMWQAGVGTMGRAWQHWGLGKGKLFKGQRLLALRPWGCWSACCSHLGELSAFKAEREVLG